jgi:hypothetical protein
MLTINTKGGAYWDQKLSFCHYLAGAVAPLTPTGRTPPSTEIPLGCRPRPGATMRSPIFSSIWLVSVNKRAGTMFWYPGGGSLPCRVVI